MAITTVVRGEEWLPSVPKHFLLYEALGHAPPQMPVVISSSTGTPGSTAEVRYSPGECIGSRKDVLDHVGGRLHP